MQTPFVTMKTRRPTESNVGGRELYKLKPNAASVAAAIQYFKTLQVYGPALTAEQDGLYTWILKRMDKTGTLLLIAGRARSAQEIGTLHQNLYEYSPPGWLPKGAKTGDDVFAAGEFLKEGTNLTYNIQSGSFMGRRFDQLRSAVRKDIQRGKAAPGAADAAVAELRARILAATHHEFTALGFTATFADCTEPDCEPDQVIAGKPMINTAPIKTTAANINIYRSFGLPTPAPE